MPDEDTGDAATVKIYLPNTSKMGIGGGLTFIDNFKAGCEGRAFFVDDWHDADVYFISSATLTPRDEVVQARAAGKQVIFRVDNIPKDSRNRGTAISRMRDYGRMADLVIFQSEWARFYAGYLVGDGTVVYNGVNKHIFRPTGEKLPRTKSRVHLVVQFNRDDNKRTTEAFYYHHLDWRKDKDCELWIVGKFSPENMEYNFDFFDGEVVRYFGVVEDREYLSQIYRSADVFYFPAFADASPNSVTEALACGCQVELVHPVGGTIEITERAAQGIIPSIYDMAAEYLSLFRLAIESARNEVST